MVITNYEIYQLHSQQFDVNFMQFDAIFNLQLSTVYLESNIQPYKQFKTTNI